MTKNNEADKERASAGVVLERIVIRDEEHMRKAVQYLADYFEKYDKQHGYEGFGTNTFVDDVLYGLGVALDDKHRFANGFTLFKDKLRVYLAI